MSFQLNKNSSGRIIKKSIPTGISYASLKASNPFIESANSLLVNNKNFQPSVSTVITTITNTDSNGVSTNISSSGTLSQAILNKTENIVLGQASAGKVLTLDANKDANGINILKCNSMIVNDVNIATDIGDPSSIVAANDYFSDNIAGESTAGKCLIPDSSLGIKIKKISGDVEDKFTLAESKFRNISINLFSGPTLSENKWIDIVYSIDLKKFVAIGDEVVATTSNGDSWTEYIKTGINFRKIVWVSHIGKFYAVALDGVYDSTDGTDWTKILNSATLGDIVDISVGRNKMVAIGSKLFVKNNTNSAQWQEITMTAGMSAVSWKSITYGIGSLISPRFVIVGNNNVCSCLESNIETAVSWTVTPLTGLWNSITFGNDVFMTVNSQAQANNKFTTSSNGIDWFNGNLSFRAMETGLDTIGLKSVKYFNFLKMFIVIPLNPPYYMNTILYTASGHEWYYLKYASGNMLANIDYSPLIKKFVGITLGVNTLDNPNLSSILSPKMLNVKYLYNQVEDYNIFNNFFSFQNSPVPEMVFACGDRGLCYSVDGNIFNKCFLLKNGGNLFDQVSRNVKCITYASGLNKFYACTTSNTTYGYTNGMMSSDGINWTDFSIGNGIVSVDWIEWSNSHNKLYVVGSNNLYSSPDGISWASQQFNSGIYISIINVNDTETVFLHGSHASKTIHILNQNMTYTPSNYNTYGLKRFTTFNGALYSAMGNDIMKSTDGGMNWTSDLNLAATAIDVVFNSKLNCLVSYSSGKVAVLFTTGGWTVSNLSTHFTLRNLNTFTYSQFHGSIYLASNNYQYSIAKTNGLKSETIISNDIYSVLGNKIWKTIPNASIHNRDLDDNLITGFKYNNTTQTIANTSNKYIMYSRKAGKWMVPFLYTSASNSPNTTESTNEFLSITSPSKHWFTVDSDIGMASIILNTGTWSSGNTSNNVVNFQLYNKYSNSTTNITNSTTLSWSTSTNIIIKFCKEMNILYYLSGTTIITYSAYVSGTVSTFDTLNITLTNGPSGIDGVMCKEKNLYVYVSNVSNVRRITTYNMTNTSNPLYNITMPNKTFLRVEYHYEAKMFIVLATDAIYYSSDGAVWTESPTTALNGYIYGLYSINYIPELNIMGLVSTNMFAYTRNGINWTIINTSISKTWISFDYNPSAGKIILLSNDGTLLITSYIQATIDNVLTPHNGFYIKNKYYVRTNNSPQPYIDNGYTIDTNNSVYARGFNRELFFQHTPTGTDLNFNSVGNNVVINKTNTLASANEIFKVNGNYAPLNSDIVDKLRFNSYLSTRPYTEYINKKGLVLSQSGGSVSLNSLGAQSITITNNALNSSEYRDMGLIVADNNNNISIDKIGINSIKTGDTELVNTENYGNTMINSTPPKTAPFMPLENYMNFKNTQFINGRQGSNIMGSAYSPQLNVLVVYCSPNSASISQCFMVSDDKGVSWTNIGINNGFSYAFNSQENTCKIKWISSLSLFCVAQDNNLMISRDGYNWFNNNVSYGTNPSLFWDTKLNMLAVITTTKISIPVNSNDIFGIWTVPTENKNLKAVEYFQPADLYFFRDNTNTTTLKSTTNIYSSTIVSTSAVATTLLITDIISWNNVLYYTGDTNIYRKTTGGTEVGTIVFTHPTITFKRLVLVDTMNILVAFSTHSFAYSTDGINWIHNIYSNVHNPTNFAHSEDGVMNNMFWTQDRLILITNSDGLVLESDIEEKIDTSSIAYLEGLITNKVSYDRLINHTKQIDLIVRHSNTPINTYGTAFGAGFFISTGDNINIISSSLKKNQSATAHTGLWRDIIYHSKSNQFIKVGSNIMSYNSGSDINTWNDITPPTGIWDNIISVGNKVIIFQSGDQTGNSIAKIATVDSAGSLELNSSTVWTDIDLSTSNTKWNGLEILNDKIFLLGNNYISYKSFSDITNAGGWINKEVEGVWNDISYGKNLYIIAGNGFIGRSRDLNIFRKIFVPKDYHKVIYVRLLSEFYLMNRDINYFSNVYVKEQTNSVIKSNDGINWINSFNSYLHINSVVAPRPYKLSNMYYFEETDQFAFPLNNSVNKYYIYTMPYVSRKDYLKVTTPQAFASNGSNIEIARGNSILVAPATFNVFEDSAAKPATSTWLTASDRRLKEDINTANLEICYNNVKNLELKYFKWRDEFINKEITTDRKKLGWIAQEVEQIIPKAVKKNNMYNMEDCRTLDSGQIIANLYGTIKLLIKKIKEKEEALL